MCSLGVQKEFLRQGGPFVVKLNGLLTHLTSWIHPTNGGPRRYSQLAVLDPEEAILQRLSSRDRLRPDYVSLLQDFFSANNPYFQSFKYLHQYSVELEAAGQTLPKIRMMIVVERWGVADGGASKVGGCWVPWTVGASGAGVHHRLIPLHTLITVLWFHIILIWQKSFRLILMSRFVRL